MREKVKANRSKMYKAKRIETVKVMHPLIFNSLKSDQRSDELEGTADRLEEKQHFSRSSSQKLVIPFGKRTVFNPSIKSNVPIG